MVIVGLAVLLTALALLLRRSRWASRALLASRCGYAALLVQAVLYFPARSGFRVARLQCEWTFGGGLAAESMRNYPHIVLFALFFFLTWAQFRGVRHALGVSTAVCMAMGLFVELAQGVTGAGHCRMRDLIPDAAGALIAMTAVVLARRVTKGGLVLAALVFLQCAERVPNRPMNFAVVEAPSATSGGIYRGGRPTAAEIATLRRDLQVKTMIRLSRGDATAERVAARLANIQLIEAPLDPKLVGTADRRTRAAVERAFRALTDRRHEPIYIYCDHGRDRTGFVVALYRLRVRRWPPTKVHEELARHGHGAFMRRYLPHITRELARESERLR
ncbi:MAG TPA: VanZ family protein [Thermoanaerobaculia bacterium]|jgi:hypothetical protein